MRKFTTFHPLYTDVTLSDSQNPEDLFTTAAIIKPGAGTRPLFAFKPSQASSKIIVPVISTGKYAFGDLDDPYEQEPERLTDAHPYMNPKAMRSWGCGSQNWWGYNKKDWNLLKDTFYRKYYPHLYDDWKSASIGPDIQDFVDKYGETQKAWDEHYKARQEFDFDRQTRAQKGILADPEHHFRNALYNVAELYHSVLAQDGRNYPGREMQADLKRFFRKNTQFRKPNVEWASDHLEKLKSDIEAYKSGEHRDGAKVFRDKFSSLGFSDRNPDVDAPNPSFEINPIIKNTEGSYLWMPNRRQPYAVTAQYLYSPTASENNRHLVTVSTFAGGTKKSQIIRLHDIDSVVPETMSRVTEQTENHSQLVHPKLLDFLGLSIPQTATRPWGFENSKSVIDFGNSPDEFEKNF